MAASSSAVATQVAKNDGGYVFQRSGLVIKDPTKTVPFYQEYFGFTLVHEEERGGQTSYLMATLEDDKIAALPKDTKSADAAAFVLAHDGTFLELIHNHGSEADEAFSVNNGNVEPHRGFGHIAVSVPDVYAFCADLEKAGVAFQKKPDEGRMKGLAFAKCPDGYWIEVISRSLPELPGLGSRPSFAQTMLRVAEKDGSIAFFTDKLGMTLLDARHFGPDRGDFSLYFLASLPTGVVLPAADDEAAKGWMTTKNLCVVELTHNHGTEADESFKYHNGRDSPAGFSHVGFTAAAGPAADLTTPRDGYAVTVRARA